jgi:hypothetical protein
MIPAFVWEYKLILRFIIRVSSHLKEALCVFEGSTIQEFTVTSIYIKKDELLKLKCQNEAPLKFNFSLDKINK